MRTTSRGQPASMASRAAAFTPSGGMNSTETSKPTSRIASRALACTGTPQCSAPAFLGFTPATMRVPYSCMRPVQNVPCFPVMPWTSTRWSPRTIMMRLPPSRSLAVSVSRPASRPASRPPRGQLPGFLPVHLPAGLPACFPGRFPSSASRPSPDRLLNLRPAPLHQRRRPRRRSPRPWSRTESPRGAPGASPSPRPSPCRAR